MISLAQLTKERKDDNNADGDTIITKEQLVLRDTINLIVMDRLLFVVKGRLCFGT